MNKELLEEKLKEIDLIIKSKYKEESQIGVLAGLARGFSSFTQTVGDSVKKGVSAIRASQPHPDQATLAPPTSSAQLGGRRRKKTKTMRKSKKARRFKHKRSRKSKH